MCKECAHERDLQIKLDEEQEQENFVDYVQDYFQLTASDERKGIRELHKDFKKQKSHRQTTSHQDSFCMLSIDLLISTRLYLRDRIQSRVK